MASMALDGDVRKTLLDRTDAEKVFRPWWDTIEDMLLNTLIGLGKTHMLHLRKNISYKKLFHVLYYIYYTKYWNFLMYTQKNNHVLGCSH